MTSSAIVTLTTPNDSGHTLKVKKQESTGIAPLKNKDGFLKSDSNRKANILNEQFSSVFTKEN